MIIGILFPFAAAKVRKVLDSMGRLGGQNSSPPGKAQPLTRPAAGRPAGARRLSASSAALFLA